MIKRLFPTFIILGASFLISTSTFASGSYDSGDNEEAPRQIDQNYELGKSIYKGRESDVSKIDYCVQVNGELLPVKRASLKSFKSTSYSELTNKLYDCNNPDSTVSSVLGSDNAYYVTYYLNKRYKLDLK